MMLSGSVTRRIPRSSYVCLQCRCNLSTTSVRPYPRTSEGHRTTSARSSSPSRPGRVSSAPLRDNDSKRQPSYPSPRPSRYGQRGQQGQRGQRSYALPGDSFRERDSNRASLHRSTDVSNAHSNRSSFSRSSDDRRSQFLAARSTSPRGSNMKSPNNSLRRIRDDGPKEQMYSLPKRRPESDVNDQVPTDAGTWHGRPKRKFADKDPASPLPVREKETWRIRTDQKVQNRARKKGMPRGEIAAGAERGLSLKQWGSYGHRDAGPYNQTNELKKSFTLNSSVSRSTRTVNFETRRPSLRAQPREPKSSKFSSRSSETSTGSSSGGARKKPLTPSLNSRIPYIGREAGARTKKLLADDPVPDPNTKQNDSLLQSSQTNQTTSVPEKHDPNHTRVRRPSPPSTMVQPISRADRRERSARQKLDHKLHLLDRNPNKLGVAEKEEAERWRSLFEKPDTTPLSGKNTVAEISSPQPEPVTKIDASGARSLLQKPKTPPPSLRDNSVAESSPARTEIVLTNQSFASYKSVTPPTFEQLAFADRFFRHGKPNFLFSTDKFRELPLSLVPEVVFLGRSNVGKSSLLNAIVWRTASKIANVSSKPGRTITMNAFGVGGEGVRWAKTSEGQRPDGEAREETARDTWVGRGGLVVLDVPGYGKSSRDVWGKEIQKYLFNRQQLRRTFVLIDSEHGLKPTDHDILSILRENSVPHQLILTKIDKVLFPPKKSKTFDDQQLAIKAHSTLPDLCDKILQEVRAKEDAEGRGGVKALGDIVCCSSEKNIPRTAAMKVGMDAVRWAVLTACGLECDVHGNKKIMEWDVVPEAPQGVAVAM